jgi:soluble lytic murein transglycosylase
MLHAYARLAEAEPERARRAREEATQEAAADPFTFAHRPEFDHPGFRRALELLRLGEVDLARRELSGLGLPSGEAAPELLWGVALLYARAGAFVLSHGVARGLLTDWLERWPAGDWVRAWEIAFPRPYRDIVSREARKNGVPEHLVYAVMREESAFEPAAVSSAHAYGLMQIIEPTARHYAKGLGLPSDPASLTKPPVNIALGCRVLADLTRRFGSNPLFAIPGYNAGPGRPRRWATELASTDFDLWVELIPFRETRRYTKRVLASRAAYAFLYDESQGDAAMRLPLKIQ